MFRHWFLPRFHLVASSSNSSHKAAFSLQCIPSTFPLRLTFPTLTILEMAGNLFCNIFFIYGNFSYIIDLHSCFMHAWQKFNQLFLLEYSDSKTLAKFITKKAIYIESRYNSLKFFTKKSFSVVYVEAHIGVNLKAYSLT